MPSTLRSSSTFALLTSTFGASGAVGGAAFHERPVPVAIAHDLQRARPADAANLMQLIHRRGVEIELGRALLRFRLLAHERAPCGAIAFQTDRGTGRDPKSQRESHRDRSKGIWIGTGSGAFWQNKARVPVPQASCLG
jgi:hypothetical protein